MRRSGFTIVELLIVIVVIAILATISVVAYNGIQERSRVTAANTELKMLENAIRTARVSTGETLLEITGSGCTRCVGTQAAYDQALDRIGDAADTNLSDLKNGDPWGNMYWIDENEGEGGSCPGNGRDIVTVNPSHTGVSGIYIPFFRCT